MNVVLEVDVHEGYYFARVIGGGREYPLVRRAEFSQLIEKFDEYHRKALKKGSPSMINLRHLAPSARLKAEETALDYLVKFHNDAVEVLLRKSGRVGKE